MCIAIAAYHNRIASLFESSEKFVIINSPSYDVSNPTLINVSDKSLSEVIHLLKANNVDILICGAIRGCICNQIEAHNIRVIPWITGEIQNVVQAYLSNNLLSSSFLMPGCRNRGFNKHQGFGRRKENY